MKNSEKTGLRSARLAGALPWLWLALVVASQTPVAGRLADGLFAMVFGAVGSGGASLHFFAQKGYHVFLFFVFGGFLALPQAGRRSALCLLWVFVVGAGAEALQLWAPGRSPQLGDALLNVISGAAAVAVQIGRKRC